MASRTQMRQASRIRIAGNRTGAWLARYALEQLPISHTFGIPGVHNTEIYDELNKSERIHPVLVTHEAGASFIGDAISRTSKGEIGTLVIVPAAGTITNTPISPLEVRLMASPMNAAPASWVTSTG